MITKAGPFRVVYHPDNNPNISIFGLSYTPSEPKPITPMLQSYINHIAFVIDKSSSIHQAGLTQDIIKVFDSQIKYLASRSTELKQETRVSVYLFATTVECVVYDIDVLRLPSLASIYKPDGWTALIDGTMKAIEDLEKTATLYGDHSFLIYAITDGIENKSNISPATLSAKIKGLPENWTLAVFVPDQTGAFEAKKHGFPAQNVSVWDATSTKGVQEAGQVMQQATDTFMRARSTGVRGTKNLFSMDASSLSAAAVKTALKELSPTQYMMLPVSKKVAIKDFVESWTKEPYQVGSAYHALVKPEKVQAGKQVCIQHKLTGKVYAGAAARQMLGLPDHEVKVEPAAHPDYSILLQSQSVNRLLVPGTQLLVMK